MVLLYYSATQARYLLAWETGCLAGEVCIREGVRYCSLDATTKLLIQKLIKTSEHQNQKLYNKTQIRSLRPSSKASESSWFCWQEGVDVHGLTKVPCHHVIVNWFDSIWTKITLTMNHRLANMLKNSYVQPDTCEMRWNVYLFNLINEEEQFAQ